MDNAWFLIFFFISIVDEPEITMAYNTKEFLLECDVQSSPPAEVVWYRGGDKILNLDQDNRTQMEVNGSKHYLIFNRVWEEDLIQYRCQANNSLGFTRSARIKPGIDIIMID